MMLWKKIHILTEINKCFDHTFPFCDANIYSLEMRKVKNVPAFYLCLR